MANTKKIKALEKIAYDPYDRIEHPTAEDWMKSYNALKELCELAPDVGIFPNTLGYLCFYGRHTGGERQYEEAREWFEKGHKLWSIESTYKLADMLVDGLGGPVDTKRAIKLYWDMYLFCKDQFESGMKESKFADTALRMGRLYHEGKATEKDDMEALGFLMEAKYALEWRKQFDQYGDATVEKNIQRLIDECEKPDAETQKAKFYGVGLGRIPRCLIPFKGDIMTFDIGVAEDGLVRLEFRKWKEDGKKVGHILWSVPPAMRCFMTDFVVLYGVEVKLIWNKNPGEMVVCDWYDYDQDKDLHLFYKNGELQCKLMGGEYALPMDEFLITEMKDHPDSGAGKVM